MKLHSMAGVYILCLLTCIAAPAEISCAGLTVNGTAKISHPTPAAIENRDLKPLGSPGQTLISGIQAIGITYSSAQITWNGAVPFSGVLQWGETTDYEFSRQIQLDQDGQPVVIVKGLKPDTSYYYRIITISNDGTLSPSPVQVFKTLEPLYTGSLSITGITVSALSSNSATITWVTDVPTAGKVDYGLTASYNSSTAAEEQYLRSHTFILRDLIDSASYHFRARAKDQAGNILLSADNVFTTLPDQHPPFTINYSTRRCKCRR